jgi:hypothetical protein
MTPLEYEQAVFAMTVWQVANSSDTNELFAVACAIRNHVIPRIGSVAGYPSFSAACEDFLRVYPTRPRPDLSDPAFVGHPDGLLANIADIYNCIYPDVTSTQDHPGGARYFARVQMLQPNDWFQLEIVNKAAVHPLLGTWGSMQFFA